MNKLSRGGPTIAKEMKNPEHQLRITSAGSFRTKSLSDCNLHLKACYRALSPYPIWNMDLASHCSQGH